MLVIELINLYRLGWNYPFNWFDGILVVVVLLNSACYFGVTSVLQSVLQRIRQLDPKIFISFQVNTHSE